MIWRRVFGIAMTQPLRDLMNDRACLPATVRGRDIQTSQRGGGQRP